MLKFAAGNNNALYRFLCVALQRCRRNLNFSFVAKTKENQTIDFKRYYIPIINALEKIGVKAELSGRNDEEFVKREGRRLK